MIPFPFSNFARIFFFLLKILDCFLDLSWREVIIFPEEHVVIVPASSLKIKPLSKAEGHVGFSQAVQE